MSSRFTVAACFTRLVQPVRLPRSRFVPILLAVLSVGLGLLLAPGSAHATPPVLIDEMQYAAELLPHIKMATDRAGRPGLFWLTGSQQFHLMQGVSESLAGEAVGGLLGNDGVSLPELQRVAPKGQYFSSATRAPVSLVVTRVEQCPATGGDQTQLWALLDQLAAPTAELPERIAIVAQLKTLLGPIAGTVDAIMSAAHQHEPQPPV